MERSFFLHQYRTVNIYMGKKHAQRSVMRGENGVNMIERFPVYFSPSSDERVISVYLPRGYGDTDETYPVMYMFDGQNAFEDEVASYGKSWGLHTFMDEWQKRMIIVGLQSSAEGDRRLAEYCPYHLAPRRWEGLRGRGRATMDYITKTLKPMIDERYRTMPQRACTGLIGDSMGALMALYAVTAYNDVFSKAACVSPALSMCYPQMLCECRADGIDPDTRVYLSFGEHEARDKRALAHMASQSLEIANVLMTKGVRVYPYLQMDGRHCEEDWSRQTERFMHFLWLDDR